MAILRRVKKCHQPARLKMVNIAAIKKVMIGGWFMVLLYPHYCREVFGAIDGSEGFAITHHVRHIQFVTLWQFKL